MKKEKILNTNSSWERWSICVALIIFQISNFKHALNSMAQIKLVDCQIGEMDVQSTTYFIHIFLTFWIAIFHLDLWLKILVSHVICIYMGSCFWGLVDEIFHCIYTNFDSILHNKITNLKTCTLKNDSSNTCYHHMPLVQIQFI
jgi:hypothetical protein